MQRHFAAVLVCITYWLAGLLAAGSVRAQPPLSLVETVRTSEPLVEVRHPVAEKTAKRFQGPRILFNGDCTYLFTDTYVKRPGDKFDKSIIHEYIKRLAASGVQAYLQNPNAQIPWFPSRRTRHILQGYRRGDGEFVRGHFRKNADPHKLATAIDTDLRMLNRYLDLQEAGIDWLAEISRACRQNGIAPWISIRMNDMHGANSWEQSYMNCDLQKDPKFRLSGRQANPHLPVNRFEQSLNYAHQEVRDYMLLQIREVVEEYDFEGLELDWLRCPFCCEAPASQADVDLMTSWFAEIRALLDRQGRKTGKQYPLGLRLPCRLGMLKAIGIDVPELAKQGIIDFVGFSNYWQTSWDVPYADLRRELGPRVAIYGVIEDAPNWMPARDESGEKTSYRLLSSSPEFLRGNAANKLAAGVDGIEFFNFFCTDEAHHNPAAQARQANYAAIKPLAQREALRGQTKQYAFASATGGYSFPFWEFAEQIPFSLKPEHKRQLRLSMLAEPADSTLEFVVQVITERSASNPELGVAFNGGWPNYTGEESERLLFPTGIYTRHVTTHRAHNYRFPVSVIREGWNEIVISNGKSAGSATPGPVEAAVQVVGVELALRPLRR